MAYDDSASNFYQGVRVLVTGGAGAIGGNLCRALSEQGASVQIIDDLSSSNRMALAGIRGCKLRVGSILDHEALTEVFSLRPRVVFHLAALFANQNSVEHPERDLLVNGLGTLRILQFAAISGVERVIFASSSSIAKAPQAGAPIDEADVSYALQTPYQMSKLLGELYSKFFQTSCHLNTVAVRLFNSYGPGELPGVYRNVIPNFIYRALRRQPLQITGSGAQTRDWTFVGDIVDGLLRAGNRESAIGEIFNLGSGKETRVLDLAHRINRIAENDAGVEHIEQRSWDKSDRRLASIGKAKRILGYEPKVELEEGLIRTVEWFRQNWNHIESRSQDGNHD